MAKNLCVWDVLNTIQCVKGRVWHAQVSARLFSAYREEVHRPGAIWSFSPSAPPSALPSPLLPGCQCSAFPTRRGLCLPLALLHPSEGPRQKRFPEDKLRMCLLNFEVRIFIPSFLGYTFLPSVIDGKFAKTLSNLF